MKRTVYLHRSITEVAEVEVDAENDDEACEKAEEAVTEEDWCIEETSDITSRSEKLE